MSDEAVSEGTKDANTASSHEQAVMDDINSEDALLGLAGDDTASEKEGTADDVGGEDDDQTADDTADDADDSADDTGDDTADDTADDDDGAADVDLGTVPKSADEYKLDLPEGVDTSEPTLRAFLDHALEQGLSHKQADGLLKWNAKMSAKQAETYPADMAEARKTFRKQNETVLRDTWKGDYKSNLGKARTGFKVLTEGDNDAREAIAATGLDDAAWFIKLMHRIGTAVGEDALVLADPGANLKNRDEDGERTLQFPSMDNKKKSA